jgi:hypothetical protein
VVVSRRFFIFKVAIEKDKLINELFSTICIVHFSLSRISMRSFEEVFNRSGFSRFLNSVAGRIFRLVAGAGFLVVGYVYRDNTLGVLSMAWSVLPLSAGAFDICYISALLGGPLSGAKIRNKYKTG